VAHSSTCNLLSRIAPREFRDAILSGAILTSLLRLELFHPFSPGAKKKRFFRSAFSLDFCDKVKWESRVMEREKERQGIYERVIKRARCGSFSFAFEIYRFF
jgi:hypothetical protein